MSIETSTSERCLARAEEAERLAAVVSYGRDRERLTRQAAEWRERAAALATAPEPPSPASPTPLVFRLLKRVRGAVR